MNTPLSLLTVSSAVWKAGIAMGHYHNLLGDDRSQVNVSGSRDYRGVTFKIHEQITLQAVGVQLAPN